MKVPGGKFSGKKSKAAAKEGVAKRQWDIMVGNGVDAAEIPKFRCGGGSALTLFPLISARPRPCVIGPGLSH